MLSLLIAATLLSQAEAAGFVPPKAAKAVHVSGPDAPQELLLVPRKPTPFVIDGPAEVTLELYGVAKRLPQAKKLRPTVVMLRQPGRKPQRIPLPRTLQREWQIRERPKLMLGAPAVHTLSLPEGRHRLVLAPSQQARFGVGVVVRLTSPAPTEAAVARADPPLAESSDAAPPAEAEAPPEALVEAPPPPAPPALTAEATPPQDDAEPDLMLPEGDGSAEDEVPLVDVPGGSLASEPALAAAEPMVVRAPMPSIITVLGAQGGEAFYRLNIDDGLGLDVIGPGTLVIDFHAHRDSARPESLLPVVVGLLVDDILVQTISLDQGDSSDFKVEGEAFAVSKRATLRVPVAAGAHKINLSLSDAAVLGVSARPRFEALGRAVDPLLLSAEAARRHDLVATESVDAPRGGVALGLYGGVAGASSLGAVGPTGLLELTISMPMAGQRMGLALLGGMLQTQRRLGYLDERRGAEARELSLEMRVAPLLGGLSWEAPLPKPLRAGIVVGGGVGLVWTVAESLGARAESEMTMAPMLMAALRLGVDLGPGALVLRGQALTSRPVDVGALSGTDVGGVMALLGYELQTF